METATTPTTAGPQALGIALIALRWLLAAFFVFVALKNLLGDEAMAADFARWGYPVWFRQLTALLQLVGGVCLIVPPEQLLGLAILGVVLLGATATHLLHDPPATALAPVVFLLPVALLLVRRLKG